MGKKTEKAEKAQETAPQTAAGQRERAPRNRRPVRSADAAPIAKKPRKKSKRQLVKMAIEKFESAIASEGFKPTVADFVRLLQVHKELEEERVREVTVRWVEPDQTEESSKT